MHQAQAQAASLHQHLPLTESEHQVVRADLKSGVLAENQAATPHLERHAEKGRV